MSKSNKQFNEPRLSSKDIKIGDIGHTTDDKAKNALTATFAPPKEPKPTKK